MTYKVGETEVWVHDRASLWNDTPEAIALMQRVDVPDRVWDTRLEVYPSGYVLEQPGSACLYYPADNIIKARQSGDVLSESSVPHEFAHRVMHVISNDAYSHGSEMMQWEVILRTAASQRWHEDN